MHRLVEVMNNIPHLWGFVLEIYSLNNVSQETKGLVENEFTNTFLCHTHTSMYLCIYLFKDLFFHCPVVVKFK